MRFTTFHRSASVRQRRSSAGFSLIEVMVVVVLILIVAVISAPLIMGQIARARVEGAATQSVGVMQRTRLQAIRMNSEQTVTASDEEISGTGQVSLLELGIFLWKEPLCYDPDNDGNIDYTADAITFDAQGKASDKAAFCVTDGRGNIFQIAVDSLQGTPRIRKYLQPGDSPSGSAGFFLDQWAWY